MKAKVSNRVGGVKVHTRPGSRSLVEPEEMWPGYNVEILDYKQGKEHLWAQIAYVYNGKDYVGWVIDEALDKEEPPWETKFPPDVDPSPFDPRPDVLGAPSSDDPLFRHGGADFFVSVVAPILAIMGLAFLAFALVKAF